MKAEYRGRKITVTEPSMKYGPCTFTVGESGEQTVYPGMVDRPADPQCVLAWLQRQIDLIDSKPIEPLMREWFYRPGTVEDCPSTKGTLHSAHIKPTDGPCTEYWCVRTAKTEAQRAARRTGITAASLASLLTRQGFTRADLRWDRTASSDGFSTEGEQRNRRVVVMWRDGIFGSDELRGELPAIAKFLKTKGYPVRVADSGGFLRVYPKGADEPSEGRPFPTDTKKES